MSKCGTGKDHCCWFAGIPCEFVKASSHPDFKWACSLREREESWDAVHETEEYKTKVQHKLEALGYKSCGSWPPAGIKCHDCGEEG